MLQLRNTIIWRALNTLHLYLLLCLFCALLQSKKLNTNKCPILYAVYIMYRVVHLLVLSKFLTLHLFHWHYTLGLEVGFSSCSVHKSYNMNRNRKPWFQASTAMLMRSALFWDITCLFLFLFISLFLFLFIYIYLILVLLLLFLYFYFYSWIVLFLLLLFLFI